MFLNVLLSLLKLIIVIMADFGSVLDGADFRNMRVGELLMSIFVVMVVVVVGFSYIIRVVDTSALLRHLHSFL